MLDAGATRKAVLIGGSAVCAMRTKGPRGHVLVHEITGQNARPEAEDRLSHGEQVGMIRSDRMRARR